MLFQIREPISEEEYLLALPPPFKKIKHNQQNFLGEPYWMCMLSYNHLGTKQKKIVLGLGLVSVFTLCSESLK